MKTVKTIKTIKIDADKCIGCRACEVICSAFHAEPKCGTVNPKRSRIRVFWDELNNVYVPIIAGPFTEEECNARTIVIIGGKEYDGCDLCRYSCPAHSTFKEPDSGVALQCDTCGEPMPEGGPMCVRWCSSDALTYEPERTEEVEVAEKE